MQQADTSFDSEDRSSTFLRNVGTLLTNAWNQILRQQFLAEILCVLYNLNPLF
jgi:hypothetical protein